MCLRVKFKKRKYNYTLNKKKLRYGQQNTVQVRQVVPPSQSLQPSLLMPTWAWKSRTAQTPPPATSRRLGTLNCCSLHNRIRQSGTVSWPWGTGNKPCCPLGKTSTYRQQAEEIPAYPVFIQNIEVIFYRILVFQSDEFLDGRGDYFSSCYTADHDRWTQVMMEQPCWQQRAPLLTGETLGGSFDIKHIKQQESSLTLMNRLGYLVYWTRMNRHLLNE